MILDANGKPILAFDAAIAVEPVKLATAGESSTVSILAYRQTRLSAAKGGKANSNRFRFKHGAMPSIAKTFVSMPFISGHDWSDARARGGTIVDAWSDILGDGRSIAARLDVVAAWAIEGVANGTIDRFSIGAEGEGEITCTIHDIPVWTDCYCWPGRDVEGLLAEWEYASARGVEISAVNVPAVEGTGITEITNARDGAPEVAQLALLCGRSMPSRPAVVAVPATMPIEPPIASARHARLCANVGLPSTATEDELDAAIEARTSHASTLATDLEASRSELLGHHVTRELERLAATRFVAAGALDQLRATSADGREAFDRALALVELATPVRLAAGSPPLVGSQRTRMQSDSAPALQAGDAMYDPSQAPDAFFQHQHNPDLAQMMRWSGITAVDVREHGPRVFTVVSNLAELIEATALRGA